MFHCWTANRERPYFDHDWVYRLLGELDVTIDHFQPALGLQDELISRR